MPNSNEPPSESVRTLLGRGVQIHSPETVHVHSSINPDRIAAGTVIHPGCRLRGDKTSIGPDCELGAEGPVTIENCQLGTGVELKAGFFSEATFLSGSNMGSGAHIRPGTLLEEGASGAHTVGLKQTIFFPFVTAGSLINFCDCLMAGGTDRKNHSEIGSSYIHFNFTPHQDKATPSLVGDVPRGVMLDQAPIFLGGQGGLIGPVRIEYGTVIPAGTMCRQDIVTGGQLYTPPAAPFKEAQAFAEGAYRAINRILINNLIYIGNLWALRSWYMLVRRTVFSADLFGQACYLGALAQIEAVLGERIKRLGELAGKMPRSLELAKQRLGSDLPAEPYSQQLRLIQAWPEIEARLREGAPDEIGSADRDWFLSEWGHMRTRTGYLDAIRCLPPETRVRGTGWLQAIVDYIAGLWRK